VWDLQTDRLIRYLPGSAFAQFITDTSSVGQSWRLFSVHDSNGELLRATPSTKPSFSRSSGPASHLIH